MRNALTCSRRAWSSAAANRSQNRCPPRAISIVFHARSLDWARAPVNFALWYYGLKHTSAAAASAFQYMIPPTSVAIAALFLGEEISPALGLGTLCILVGLLATQIASSRQVPSNLRARE